MHKTTASEGREQRTLFNHMGFSDQLSNVIGVKTGIIPDLPVASWGRLFINHSVFDVYASKTEHLNHNWIGNFYFKVYLGDLKGLSERGNFFPIT